MNEESPHLPERDKEQENRSINNLLWLGLVVFLSGLTALAASLAVEAWLVPYSLENRTPISIENRGQSNDKSQMDQLLQNQIEQKVVSIYDKRKKIEDKYYSSDSKLAEGVILSSNGWVAFHNPDFDLSEYRFLEIVDDKGVIHQVDSVKYDNKSNITYIQLDSENFRVSSLFDWTNGDPQKVWRIKDDSWNLHELDHRIRVSQDSNVSISKPQYYFNIENQKTSQLLFDSKGALVGFSDNQGNILPSWYISNQLSNILSNQGFSYLNGNMRGKFIDIRTSNEDSSAEETSAFYVQSAEGIVSEKIKKGDLLLEIDNKTINSTNASRLFLTASRPVQLTIIRDDKEKIVEIGS